MLPGSLFADRFEALRAAHSGGMGTVFRARDRVSGAEVAVKVLLGQGPQDVERFTREAIILAGLGHPGIVRYVAHGITKDGEHYLAMEWLEGEDLAARLVRRGLTMAESLSIVRRAAEALAVAHQRGLVHRDLKPSNLFLCRGEVEGAKIVDFGIARLGFDTARVTRTGVLLGTPGYMAPEQIEGPPVHDPRADVFALGCVLFECLTGRAAFEGVTAMSVLAKILLQELPRVRTLRAEVPPAVDDLVARMMAREPAHRPRDGAEVVKAIAALGDLGKLPGGTAPQVDPRRALGPPPAEPLSLTMSEQRLVSVVLAGRVEDEDLGMARHDQGELTAAIQPHGGTLHVLAGGALVVTFWGHGSAGDRAARAARCALALKARFASLPVCVVTGRGLVSARIVEGDLIERAVRTLRVSRADAVRVDDPTAGLIGARFRIDPENPAASHAGRASATHVLRGERLAAEGVPLLLGQATPCVGRTRELSILEGVFAGCVSEPVASAVLVVGDPGSGKSRLRREFLEALRRRGDDVEILSGAGEAVGAGSPYRMLADALRRAAGIHEGDPLDVRQNKLRGRVARRLDASAAGRVTAFFGELLGASFPDDVDLASEPWTGALRAARESPLLMGDGIRAAWEDWLAAECAAQPVLLVLEDLHWGDAATVSLIDGALRNLRELPLMVVCTARPEVHTAFPNLWSEREAQLVRLGPLSRKASEQLVRAALGDGAADDLVARLCERGQGNPFYLEELVRATRAGRADALPDSVLGTVEARLDAEGAAAKRVLRAASVFGDRFHRSGVLALLGGDVAAEGEVDGCLEALVSRELLEPTSARSPLGRRALTGNPAEADPSYAFCHAIVRDAAYATLTSTDRSLGHRLAGAWLEGRGGADAMTLAEHYRLGGDADKSARWYRRAAEQALEANDLSSAVARADQGLACHPGERPRALSDSHPGERPRALSDSHPGERPRALSDVPPGAVGGGGAAAPSEERGLLLLVKAEAEVWRGELAAAEESALAAAEVLQPGSAPWFRALTHAVVAAGKRGGTRRIEARAEQVAATAPAPGARSAQIVCLGECATHLLYGGRYAEADRILARLHAAVPEPTLLEAPVAGQLQQIIALRALYEGDPAASLEGYEAALSAYELASDRRSACVVRCSLGCIFNELGDFESAEEALRLALAGATRMGLDDLAAAVMTNLGQALAHRSRLDEARLYAQRAVEAFHRLGDPRMEGVSRTYLAKVDLRRGDLDRAEAEARLAADLLAVAPPVRPQALATLARVLLTRGRAAEALAAAREAQAALDEIGTIEEGETLVRLVYVDTLSATGDGPGRDEAAAVAQERLLARAERISDPAWRERFLTGVPDNARTLALGGR